MYFRIFQGQLHPFKILRCLRQPLSCASNFEGVCLHCWRWKSTRLSQEVPLSQGWSGPKHFCWAAQLHVLSRSTGKRGRSEKTKLTVTAGRRDF